MHAIFAANAEGRMLRRASGVALASDDATAGRHATA
jgi:hypothetical protein